MTKKITKELRDKSVKAIAQIAINNYKKVGGEE